MKVGLLALAVAALRPCVAFYGEGPLDVSVQQETVTTRESWTQTTTHRVERWDASPPTDQMALRQSRSRNSVSRKNHPRSMTVAPTLVATSEEGHGAWPEAQAGGEFSIDGRVVARVLAWGVLAVAIVLCFCARGMSWAQKLGWVLVGLVLELVFQRYFMGFLFS